MASNAPRWRTAWNATWVAVVWGMAVTSSAEAQLRARITGKVSSSAGVPIAGARVAVPGTHSVTTADSTGIFVLVDVPAGARQLAFRHLGFHPVMRDVVVPDSGSVVVDVALAAVPLEGVNVEESGVIPSFEEHRRMGLGHFVTREQLQEQEQRRLADILGQVSGIKVRNGRGGNMSWVYSNRRPVTSITKFSRSFLDDADVNDGADPRLCYAQVYLDQVPVYRGREQEGLFNVNSILPHEIEAIEYYAGPSVTPARYSGLNSQCGVLVIHRRRTR